MLSLGGGNAGGLFTVDALSEITKDMNLIVDSNYTGIVFDVEETIGSSSDLIPAFNDAFQAAQDHKLTVVVTTSHSAPYATDTPQDSVDLVKSWVSNPNIDVISPQLYASGMEAEPDFAETEFCKESGCTWDLYNDCLAIFAPSVVDETHVPATQEYFGDLFSGYFVWAQS